MTVKVICIVEGEGCLSVMPCQVVPGEDVAAGECDAHGCAGPVATLRRDGRIAVATGPAARRTAAVHQASGRYRRLLYDATARQMGEALAWACGFIDRWPDAEEKGPDDAPSDDDRGYEWLRDYTGDGADNTLPTIGYGIYSLRNPDKGFSVAHYGKWGLAWFALINPSHVGSPVTFWRYDTALLAIVDETHCTVDATALDMAFERPDAFRAGADPVGDFTLTHAEISGALRESDGDGADLTAAGECVLATIGKLNDYTALHPEMLREGPHMVPAPLSAGRTLWYRNPCSATTFMPDPRACASAVGDDPFLDAESAAQGILARFTAARKQGEAAITIRETPLPEGLTGAGDAGDLGDLAPDGAWEPVWRARRRVFEAELGAGDYRVRARRQPATLMPGVYEVFTAPGHQVATMLWLSDNPGAARAEGVAGAPPEACGTMASGHIQGTVPGGADIGAPSVGMASDHIGGISASGAAADAVSDGMASDHIPCAPSPRTIVSCELRIDSTAPMSSLAAVHEKMCATAIIADPGGTRTANRRLAEVSKDNILPFPRRDAMRYGSGVGFGRPIPPPPNADLPTVTERFSGITEHHEPRLFADEDDWRSMGFGPMIRYPVDGRQDAYGTGGGGGIGGDATTDPVAVGRKLRRIRDWAKRRPIAVPSVDWYRVVPDNPFHHTTCDYQWNKRANIRFGHDPGWMGLELRFEWGTGDPVDGLLECDAGYPFPLPGVPIASLARNLAALAAGDAGIAATATGPVWSPAVTALPPVGPAPGLITVWRSVDMSHCAPKGSPLRDVWAAERNIPIGSVPIDASDEELGRAVVEAASVMPRDPLAWYDRRLYETDEMTRDYATRLMQYPDITPRDPDRPGWSLLRLGGDDGGDQHGAGEGVTLTYPPVVDDGFIEADWGLMDRRGEFFAADWKKQRITAAMRVGLAPAFDLRAAGFTPVKDMGLFAWRREARAESEAGDMVTVVYAGLLPNGGAGAAGAAGAAAASAAGSGAAESSGRALLCSLDVPVAHGARRPTRLMKTHRSFAAAILLH